MKKTGKDFVDDGYPAFGAGGINGFVNEYERDEDAVILSSNGARCGKCFLAFGKWTSLANTTVIIPDPNIADAKFLWYQLNDEKRWVKYGTGQPFIRPSMVKTHLVELPSIVEQKRIVAILDKANGIKESSKKTKEIHEKLISSLFHEMFGDTRLNPNSYMVKELREVVSEGTTVTYGIVQAGPEVENGVPYIRTKDISNGKIQGKNLRHTDPEIARKFERSMVREGDLVISIRATVGTIAMTPSSLDGANLTQGTARISPGDSVTGDFLLWHIRSQGSQQWISQQIKGVTFKEITLTRLRTLPVMIPPLKLQNLFTQYVEHINSLFEKIEDANNLSSTKSKAITQEMLS